MSPADSTHLNGAGKDEVLKYLSARVRILEKALQVQPKPYVSSFGTKGHDDAWEFERLVTSMGLGRMWYCTISVHRCWFWRRPLRSRPNLLSVVLMASLEGRNTVIPATWSDRMSARQHTQFQRLHVNFWEERFHHYAGLPG